MRMYQLIKKKRDGESLTDEEIRAFVEGYTSGEIPDYQAAALCMAIYFRGMTPGETTALTLAIRDSGECLRLPRTGTLRVDKHSTGGVGDKTSLVVAPIVAACGVTVAKMSGRGLGHTGGTVDKLESIPGFRTDLGREEFEGIVARTGLAIVGQSATLAPADKKLYALRDVTATVDSMPLIAASIMGKKLAADDDGIVLDVKTGSGGFMKTLKESRELAALMVEIGRRAGKRMSALVTDMDTPLGYAVGNTVEVIEAIETLSGRGPADLVHLSVSLATEMLCLAGKGEREACEEQVREALASGRAKKKFEEMVEAQGGDPRYVREPDRFPRAPYLRTVTAPRSGYLIHMDAETLGEVALFLGAGRNALGDSIDHTAGFRLTKKVGEEVEAGEPLAVLYTSKPERLDRAEADFLGATLIGDTPPVVRPLIFERIS